MKTITISGTVKTREKLFCASPFNPSLLSNPPPLLLGELKSTLSLHTRQMHTLFFWKWSLLSLSMHVKTLKLWTFFDLSISSVAQRALTLCSMHRGGGVRVGKRDVQTGEGNFMGHGCKKQRLTSTEAIWEPFSDLKLLNSKLQSKA